MDTSIGMPDSPDVNQLLVPGEVAVAAYKTFRDSAIFTNKRLIVRDAQGSRERRLRFIRSPTPPSICGLQKMLEDFLI